MRGFLSSMQATGLGKAKPYQTGVCHRNLSQRVQAKPWKLAIFWFICYVRGHKQECSPGDEVSALFWVCPMQGLACCSCGGEHEGSLTTKYVYNVNHTGATNWLSLLSLSTWTIKWSVRLFLCKRNDWLGETQWVLHSQEWKLTKILFIKRQLQWFSLPNSMIISNFYFPLFRFVVISDCLLWFSMQSKFKYTFNC